MSAAEPARVLVDALLWNYPALRRGSNAAQHFAAAMLGDVGPSEAKAEDGEQALWLAARGVEAERAQEFDVAEALFGELAGDEDPWIALSGLMLHCWSEGNSDTEAIASVREHLASLNPESELHARLLGKLATFAFDKAAIDLGRDCLSQAINLAPSGTALNRALAVEGLNAGLEYEWSAEQTIPDPDPLVEYPWIEATAYRAVETALTSQVEASGRGVWTNHFKMGRTPIDDAISAEVQATWAGALWLRRPIRKQLGALLLSGGAQTPPQWSYGVLMWALGAGSNPEAAFALSEPHLERESADFIVKTLAESEIAPRLSGHLLAVAVEAWDEISEDLLRQMIDAHPEPSADDHPIENELRRLWAGYAARLTEEWLPRFEEFDIATQVAMLEVIGTRMLSDLSDDAKRVVHDAIGRAIAGSLDFGTQLLMIYATSSNSEPPDEEMRTAIAERASASAIARLAQAEHSELLSDEALGRARAELLGAVRKESEDARNGSVSYGREDARLDLGRLIAATGGAPGNAEGVELLMAIATDQGLPPHHLLQSRTALTLVRRSALLTAAQLRVLHGAADPAGGFGGLDGVSHDVLEVSRLRILAAELTEEEVVALVGHCRSSEAKVRDLALATCADAAEASPSDGIEALAWSIVGGLFDPNDEVIENVAAIITPDFIHRYPAAGQVARSRFPALLDYGKMRVRATVRLRVKEWAEDESLADEMTAALLRSSSEDRSWIVRNT